MSPYKKKRHEGEDDMTTEQREPKRPRDGSSDGDDINSDGDEKKDDCPAVVLENYKKGLLVTGDTITIKSELKEAGGRWNGTLRGWIFTPKSIDNVVAAVEATKTLRLDNRFTPNSSNDSATGSSASESKGKSERRNTAKDGAIGSETSKVDVKAGVVVLANYKKAVLLTGDTRSIKDNLKALGGRWNSSLKGWVFRSSEAENVAAECKDVNFDNQCVALEES